MDQVMKVFFLFSLFAGAVSLTAQEEPPSRCPFTYYDDTMYSPYLYGEWLYWQPVAQDPMNWQLRRNEYTNAVTGLARFFFQTESLNFDFTSGFRVGAGYRIGKNALNDSARPWQIEALYTQLVAETDSSNGGVGQTSSVPYNNDFVTNLLPAIFADLADFLSGHSKAKLSYRRCDVEFAWPVWIQGGGVIRFLIGPTFSWIQERWTTTWVPADEPAVNSVELRWKWWGGGINFGTDLHLPVGKGIGFFFNGGTAFSIGRMEDKEKYSYLSPDNNLIYSDSYRFHSFQPELNCGAGIDYKYWFRKRVLFSFAAGWEFTWWFFLNQFGRVNDPSYSNNLIQRPTDVDLATSNRFFDNSPSGLGFHGLNLRAGLDF